MAKSGGYFSRGRRHKQDAGEHNEDAYDDQSGYNGHGGPYQDPDGYQRPAWHDAQNGYGYSGGYGQPEEYQGSDPYAGQYGYGDQGGYADQHGYGDQGGYADQRGYADPRGYGDPPGGQDGYGAGGYGGYPDPGGYGQNGGYSEADNYGYQGGYGGSRYDQTGYGEPGYTQGYGDPGNYGAGQAGSGRHSADPASSPGLGSHDPYDRGYTDPSGSSQYDPDTGSHGSWAFTPGYNQGGHGYGPDAQGYDPGVPEAEPFPSDATGGFGADSGSFGRPDTGSFGRPDSGSFGRPDSGSFGRPDTGSFGRPDTGAFDVADSGSFGRPDTGPFRRADSGRIRRIDGGTFGIDDDFDADRDRDPGTDTGSIRWKSGPPPLRGSEDDDVPSGDAPWPDRADGRWQDDEDGFLSRRFGQAGGPPEPDIGRGSGRGRKRRGRMRGKAASTFAIIVVVFVVAVAGFFGYRFVNKWITNRYGDYSGQGTGTVKITVQHDATLSGLGPELVQKGVIMTLRPYDTAAQAAGGKPLLPGVYKLHHHMNSAIAVQYLLSGKHRSQATLLITEGTRASTIATKLAAATGYKASAIEDIIKHPPADLGIPSWAPKGVSAEGFLFPDTYTVLPKETPMAILKQMVQEFNTNVATIHLVSEAAKVFTTPYHALIVASLIQAEGGRLQDFGGISRVVWNRLKFHMKLQFDSTVFYAMGKHGTAITLQDEKYKSPYNTYLNLGLPPGPIGNPGTDAMQAAVHPVKAGYLYFITDTSAKPPYPTYFANTLQKFNELKQKYQG
jgi:UPF0755 protein